MSIERAYRGACSAIAQALIRAQFITAETDLHVDDAAAEGLTGDEEEARTFAAILQETTRPERQLMGGSRKRYVVIRPFQLELAVVGPDAKPRRESLDRARLLIAGLPDADPQLQGACERFFIGTQDQLGEEPGDLPPDGLKTVFPFTIRVRSGDPLGQTD